jgi:predicted lactoylglutathione lyase
MNIVISLPISDRATSHAFYAALGLVAVGEPASDGLPEPLQFVLNDGTKLMLVPRGGFGWVIGEHAVAERGTNECVLALHGDVDALLATARAAGAEVVAEPELRPWGYTGTFADPDGHLWMVSS